MSGVVQRLARLVLDLRRRLEIEREAREQAEEDLERLQRETPPPIRTRAPKPTLSGLQRMIPAVEDAAEIKHACDIIGLPGRDLIRQRLHAQCSALTESEALVWVRSWLTATAAAMDQHPDQELILRDRIGPRYDHLRAACTSAICDDLRVWRHLLTLFCADNEAVDEALWIAWETCHADSSDRIILSTL